MIKALLVDCVEEVSGVINRIAQDLAIEAKKSNGEFLSKDYDVVFVYAHGANAKTIIKKVLDNKPPLMQIVLIDGTTAESLLAPGVDHILNEPIDESELVGVFDRCLQIAKMVKSVNMMESQMSSIEEKVGIHESTA